MLLILLSQPETASVKWPGIPHWLENSVRENTWRKTVPQIDHREDRLRTNQGQNSLLVS